MINADLDIKIKVTKLPFKTTKAYTLRELYNYINPRNFIDNRVRKINNLSDFTGSARSCKISARSWYLPYTYTQHLISSKESIA